MANTNINPFGEEGQAASGLGIVNNLTTGGANKALSGEMGLLLKREVNSLYTSLNRLYSKLANMAFWDSTDQSDAAPTALNWNVPQVTVGITNSIGANVVIKKDGTAITFSGGSASLTVDKGGPLSLTIEAVEDYALSNVAATVDGDSETMTEVVGVYTLSLEAVNANTAIVISGSATTDWNIAPKNDVLDGNNQVTMYGMQQGRSINPNYGFTTSGISSNDPQIVCVPAGVPASLKKATGTYVNVNGTNVVNTNPGTSEEYFIPTNGKKYINLKLIESDNTNVQDYYIGLGCYGTGVIGNNYTNGTDNTIVTGWIGRDAYHNDTPVNGVVTWKLNLHDFAVTKGNTAGSIAYVKIILFKKNVSNSDNWIGNITLKYKFTDA